jgi:mRNA-degrading endonuclease RelE of RelBE toxin-antitoxin system
MTDGPYELVVARPAARAIAEHLPEAVSVAVNEFITGALIENPQRAGRELRNELVGIHSARRGTYRVLGLRRRCHSNSDGSPHRPSKASKEQ